jgi:hypothetical protein
MARILFMAQLLMLVKVQAWRSVHREDFCGKAETAKSIHDSQWNSMAE